MVVAIENHTVSNARPTVKHSHPDRVANGVRKQIQKFLCHPGPDPLGTVCSQKYRMDLDSTPSESFFHQSSNNSKTKLDSYLRYCFETSFGLFKNVTDPEHW
jgi:hypothetical protein